MLSVQKRKWVIAAKLLSYVPLAALEAVSLNFFAGQDADISHSALGQLDWMPMREVLSRFLTPREPSVTIFANTGFDDFQIEYILHQLPELADREALYINGSEDLPSAGVYDEVAMRMMEDGYESDALSPSEDESDVAMSDF